jgi:hypothetical protein
MIERPKISIPVNRESIILECPKCGARCEDEQIGVTVEQVFDVKEKRWVDSKRIIRATISTTFAKLPENAKCICEKPGEHLHHRCYICNFYWSSPTLEQAMGLGE